MLELVQIGELMTSVDTPGAINLWQIPILLKNINALAAILLMYKFYA
ncbi:MAG: hypothetical protein KME29_05470 [Calothrix sp. FI2-JRJ7]|jgi:hypothetical protein|nr:hypothetical protein [Calothrix sp. FI2-JRJ7]